MKQLLVFLASSMALYALAETQEFTAANIKSVEYENLAGDLLVEVTPSDKAQVSIEKKKFAKECKLTTSQEANKLILKVEDTTSFNNAECEVDFKIKVPKELALYLKVGAGDLVIKNTKGPVDAKIASGKLDIQSEITNLQAKLATGSIKAIGLTGSAEIKVANGDSKIQYNSMPSQGGAHFDVANGDATVLIPGDAKVSASLKSLVGDLTNEVGHDPKAKFKITMSSANGDLFVKAVK